MDHRSPPAAWLAGLSDAHRTRFVEVGLLAESEAAPRKLLSAHVDDFQRSLGDKGNAETHISLTVSRTRAVLDAIKATHARDLDAGRAPAHLDQRRSAELDAHLKPKFPKAAFNMPAKGHIAEMVRADCANARAAWIGTAKSDAKRAEQERSDFLRTPRGAVRVLDFHGLRHRFVTGVARSGISRKVAQSLARHSGVRLTRGPYAHVLAGDPEAAVARPPDVVAPVAERQRGKVAAGGETVSPAASAAIGPVCPGGGPRAGRREGSLAPVRVSACRDIPPVVSAASAPKHAGMLEGSRVLRGDLASERGRWRRDSNPRITDLQSVPLDHSGTPPRFCEHAMPVRVERLVRGQTAIG